MKLQSIPVSLLTALFICVARHPSVEARTPTITPIASFLVDSDNFTETRALAINGNADVAGYVEDQGHMTEGFIRFRDGTEVIVSPPNSLPGNTTLQAINDSGLVAGHYVKPDRTGSIFFFSNDTYTDVTVPGASSSTVEGLNNAGNFEGIAYFPGDGDQPYISLGGEITLYSVPGVQRPFSTFPGGMNNLNQVVGYYSSETGNHGFLRNADNTVTFPIDYPGAVHTLLYGINDKGWMVGSYIDTAGVTHGFFASSPSRFFSFDFPDSISTSLDGINNRGIICGYYSLSFGAIYGALARVSLGSSN